MSRTTLGVVQHSVEAAVVVEAALVAVAASRGQGMAVSFGNDKNRGSMSVGLFVLV